MVYRCLNSFLNVGKQFVGSCRHFKTNFGRQYVTSSPKSSGSQKDLNVMKGTAAIAGAAVVASNLDPTRPAKIQDYGVRVLPSPNVTFDPSDGIPDFSGKSAVRMILGGTGQMGGLLRTYFAEKDVPVIATSRSGKPKGEEDLDNVNWVRTANTASADEWKEHFKRALLDLGPGQFLHVINTIGAPQPEKGKTLDDANVIPAEASIKGLMAAADELKMKDRIYFTHISSIAAGAGRIPGDEYAASKTKSEDAVLSHGGNRVNVLRMGYGIENPSYDERTVMIDDHHAYTPSQMATIPVQTIIGHGKQPVQPVSMEDTVEAIENAPFHPNLRVVDVVGREVLSQEEFYKFYRDLIGDEYRPIYIPPEEALRLAEEFPRGHYAPYAVKYLGQGGFELDATGLETLIGRPTKSIRQMYPCNDGDQYVMVKPPILDHVKDSFYKIFNAPYLIPKVTACFIRMVQGVLVNAFCGPPAGVADSKEKKA